MTQQRRTFSADEKVAVLKRHLIDRVPISDICEQAGIHPTIFYRWQKLFFENGANAFKKQTDGREKNQTKEIETLRAKLARKDEVIGEIMADCIQLKKSLGEN